MSTRVVIERVARSTGTTVHLVDRGKDDGDDHRWETICVDHGGVCSHETRKLASEWLSHPDEWCEDCQHGAGTLSGERSTYDPTSPDMNDNTNGGDMNTSTESTKTYSEIERDAMPSGSFRYGQLASVESVDAPLDAWLVCTTCAHFEDDETWRTVLVVHFIFRDESEARSTASSLSREDVTLVRPAKPRNAESARETLRELEVELDTTLRLGYVGNCSSSYDASKPRRYPANYDDRSWDVCFVDLVVPKSDTSGRGPWSHRASGMSYPATRSWSTSEFPSSSELASLVRERFARESVSV